MATVSLKSEAASPSIGMLRTAMGPAITGWLDDPVIVEIMLNPDGRLWIDRLARGLSDTGKRLSAEDGERIVRVVAHHVGAEVHPASPRISAALPENGERFEGLIPPIVAALAFAIRKSAVAIFTLGEYSRAGAIAIIEAETGRPWEHDAKTWMRVSISIQAILNGFRCFEESEPSPGTRAAPPRRLLKSLEAAMRRHFKAGRIWNEPRGKPSLKQFRIALK